MIPTERIVELWSEAIKDIDSHDGETIRFARAVEREAYETAAKVCDQLPGFRINEREHFAAAIRAMKERT